MLAEKHSAVHRFLNLDLNLMSDESILSCFDHNDG